MKVKEELLYNMSVMKGKPSYATNDISTSLYDLVKRDYLTGKVPMSRSKWSLAKFPKF